MSPRRRNVTVGVVVLGGLIFLGWMLIQFGARFVSPFAPPFMRVHFIANRADGLSNGSAVLFRGVNVGRVEKVKRDSDGLRVQIDAMVDREPPLPGNLRGLIRTQSPVSGGGAIIIELTDAEPRETLKEDQTIQAQYVGLDIIPIEFTALASEITATARQFRESNLVGHADEQVMRLGKLIDSIQSLVEDPKLRDDLKSTLANLREITERANRVAVNLEQFSADLPKLSANANDTLTKTQAEILSISKQISERMQQVSRVLDGFQSITAKLDKGDGTAGQLVNDPKLYQALVDSAQQLNATVTDLRRLVNQWEQEGVSLRAK